MAVRLKTTSVQVSFIQIMQVRVQNNGKSVWRSRYVGDVSMAVPSVLSPLFRHLCLLRRGLSLLSLASEVPGLLDVLFLRASQLSSPAQKRVMSVVRAAMDFGFSWPRCRASHSSEILCLKAAKASTSGQSTIWFFLVRNRVQNFLDDTPGC